MNIFDQKQEKTERIEKRSREFVHIASAHMSKMSGEEGDRGFLTAYHGFSCHTNYHVRNDYVDNPHYNPDLPHTEENRKLQTGFNKICVQIPEVNISCTERGDLYDDWEPDGKFGIHQIPFELWEGGTPEEIQDFIRARFEVEAARTKHANLTGKYYPLFNFTPGELREVARVMEDFQDRGENIYVKADEIFKELGVL